MTQPGYDFLRAFNGFVSSKSFFRSYAVDIAATETTLYVFPNPANTGELYFRILHPMYHELRLVIRDAAGRKDYAMVASENFPEHVNIRNLPPGAHFLQVLTG